MTQKFSLDLKKSSSAFRLSLDKAGVPPDIQAELIVVMDVSGSFEHEHKEGTTGILLERFVPLAKVLDPDGKIDLITFAAGPESVEYLGEIDESNARNFIVDNVVGKVRGWDGGTTYSYALEEALRVFGWLPSARVDVPGRQPRFWQRLLGITPEPALVTPHSKARKRSIVLFVTDGENDPGDRYHDKSLTRHVLAASQKRGDEVYFLFIGACEHEEFTFVERLAEEYRNTGLVMATDPEAFVNLPDDALIAKLLGKELLDWLKA